MTAITINSTAHSVSGDMLIDHDSEITISSVQYNKATKHAVIEYAVIASAKNVIVSAESIFPDVSIVISEGTNLDGRFYKALDATRPNYTERVSYKFYLIDPFK